MSIYKKIRAKEFFFSSNIGNFDVIVFCEIFIRVIFRIVAQKVCAQVAKKIMKKLAFFQKNKPENPFQNYELAKKILEKEKKILCLKNTLIQPLEVQKPETGQKTGPWTTGKILCANEPV